MHVSDGRGRSRKKISGRSRSGRQTRDERLPASVASSNGPPACRLDMAVAPNKAVGTPSARSAAPERGDNATGNGGSLARAEAKMIGSRAETHRLCSQHGLACDHVPRPVLYPAARFKA